MKKTLLSAMVLLVVFAVPSMGMTVSPQMSVTDQQYVQYKVVPTVYTVRTTVTKRVVARRMPAQPMPVQAMYNYPQNCGPQYPPNYSCYSRCQYVPPRNNYIGPEQYGCPVVDLCSFPLRILDSIFGGDNPPYYAYR